MANKDNLTITDTSFYGWIDDSTPQGKEKAEKVKKALKDLDEVLQVVREKAKGKPPRVAELLSNYAITTTLDEIKAVINNEVKPDEDSSEEEVTYTDEDVLRNFNPDREDWCLTMYDEDGYEFLLTDCGEWDKVSQVCKILEGSYNIDVELSCYHTAYWGEGYLITATYDYLNDEWHFEVTEEEN